jgi:3-dehydroquinate synthetase
VELIHRNLKFKASVIQDDPHDRLDRRAILNLGHTIGHAIETCCEYAYRHGECVGLGLLAECAIAERECGLDPSISRRLKRLMQRFGLPDRLASPLDLQKVLAAMRQDKKNSGGSIRFALLRAIGQPVFSVSVPQSWIRTALGDVFSTNS